MRAKSIIKKISVCMFIFLFLLGTILSGGSLLRTVEAASLLSDNFESYTSFPSGGWATASSTGAWTIATDGSKVAKNNVSSTGTYLLTNGTSTWTNYSVSARVKPGTTGTRHGLAFRYKDTSNYYTFILKDGSKVYLYKKVSGSETAINYANYSYSSSSFYTLKATINGSTITCYVNGTQVLTATDSSLTAGKVALYTFGNASFDDVLVEDSSSSTPTPTSTTNPTPTPTVTPTPTNLTYPADLLDLTNWKVTLPIGSSGSPTEIKQPALATYSINPWFTLNSAKNAVQFRANCGGVTTSGSSYPRSELREMTSNGTANASWSTTSGTHRMYIKQAITHLPVVKPHVVAGQIHDSSDDVTVFRLEGTNLYITDGDTTHAYLLTSNYQLGTIFTVEMVASGGKIEYYYNGNKVSYSQSKSISGCYFKAGCYTQSNTSKGDAADAYGEVYIYDLKITHQ